jgi:HEAT repeat protein
MLNRKRKVYLVPKIGTDSIIPLVQAAAAAAGTGYAFPQLELDIVSRLQDDSEPVVRRAAAEVLGELRHHSPSVEQALTKAAESDEPSVRSAARKSLAALEASSITRDADAISLQAFETA